MLVPEHGAVMKATRRVGRLLAAGALVVTPLLVAACDLAVGPPVEDIGYEHHVGPAKAPATGGHKSPPDARP